MSDSKLETLKKSKQSWISFFEDRLRTSSALDKHFDQISYTSFRLILVLAISALMVMVIRGFLLGAPFPWADTANLIFLAGVYWLTMHINLHWRTLAWIVLLSFVLNSFDGLVPMSREPITPTHILLPLLVFFGAILGDLFLILGAAIIVLGIYCATVIYYWPLSRADILQLTNLMLLTIIAAAAAYCVWLYQRKMLNILKTRTLDLEYELDTNLQLNAVIFHDICNPLSAMIGLIDLAKFNNQVKPGDIELIGKNAERIQSIIDSVRELNVRNSGSLATSTIKVSEIAQELNDIFIPRLEQKQQHLMLTRGGDLEVQTHRSALCNSVLSNILSNAIKFSPRGASIEMKASREGDFVRLEVHDQGKGFPRVLLEKIIKGERYASRQGTEEEEGQGYGLRIAAMYAQRIRGSLEIRNRGEGGATVAVRLPAAGAGIESERPLNI